MSLETLSINHRFCGPSLSGNGGYTCGRIARHIPGIAAVRLAIPPPLDVTLEMEKVGDHVRLMHGETLVGEGRPSSLNLEPPKPFTFEKAVEASQFYTGFKFHSFPRCFVCGPKREVHDGLRIFAGRVHEEEPVASPWVVDESLAVDGKIGSEFIWAALDCPGAFAVAREINGVTIVLGELTARIDGEVKPGERCISMGWKIGEEGRKHFAGTAVFSEKGKLIGIAKAIWMEIPAHLLPPDSFK